MMGRVGAVLDDGGGDEVALRTLSGLFRFKGGNSFDPWWLYGEATMRCVGAVASDPREVRSLRPWQPRGCNPTESAESFTVARVACGGNPPWLALSLFLRWGGEAH